MNIKSLSVGVLLGAGIATLSVFFLVGRASLDAVNPSLDADAQSVENVLYWVAPMDANYRRDKPGKSPMGMDLVPVLASSTGAMNLGEIEISAAVENNLGVRIEAVMHERLKPTIEAFGVVGHNEDSRVQITVRAEGWIENLQVFDEGDEVTLGQKLFDFYSPQLLNAQDNYLSAKAAFDTRLIRGALGRMRSLAIPQVRIDLLDKLKPGQALPESFRTLPFLSPRNGHISMLSVRDGGYITPSQVALEVVSIDSVWLVADVFERHLARLKLGQTAVMNLDYFPERRWSGEVEYLYPMLDVETRSQRVRLEFDNQDHSLKPNMFARIHIQTGDFDAVTVPREALIRTQSDVRVVKALGDGRFRSVSVETGWEVDGKVVVLGGVEAGDRVVVSGQFLLDSESNLRAELMRMEGAQ